MLKSIVTVSLIVFFSFLMNSAHADNSGRMAVSGALGYFSSSLGTVSDSNGTQTSNLSGLFGIGGDFDYYLNNEMSFGGIVRYYTTNDTLTNTAYTNTLTSLGGVFRAHLLNTDHWTFGVTSGLGVVDATVNSSPPNRPSVNTDSGMAFGLYLGETVMYKVSDRIQVGIENLRILGLGSRVNGWVLSDYMAKVIFFL